MRQTDRGQRRRVSVCTGRVWGLRFFVARTPPCENNFRTEKREKRRREGRGRGGDIPRITVSLPVLDGEAAGVVLDGDALTAGLAEDAP